MDTGGKSPDSILVRGCRLVSYCFSRQVRFGLGRRYNPRRRFHARGKYVELRREIQHPRALLLQVGCDIDVSSGDRRAQRFDLLQRHAVAALGDPAKRLRRVVLWHPHYHLFDPPYRVSRSSELSAM